MAAFPNMGGGLQIELCSEAGAMQLMHVAANTFLTCSRANSLHIAVGLRVYDTATQCLTDKDVDLSTSYEKKFFCFLLSALLGCGASHIELEFILTPALKLFVICNTILKEKGEGRLLLGDLCWVQYEVVSVTLF